MGLTRPVYGLFLFITLFQLLLSIDIISLPHNSHYAVIDEIFFSLPLRRLVRHLRFPTDPAASTPTDLLGVSDLTFT